MGRQDDELNEFSEDVTDGAYTLPCYEVRYPTGLWARPVIRYRSVSGTYR